MRNETELDALNDELVAIVRETVQPAPAARCGCALLPYRMARGAATHAGEI